MRDLIWSAVAMLMGILLLAGFLLLRQHDPSAAFFGVTFMAYAVHRYRNYRVSKSGGTPSGSNSPFW